MTTCSLSECLHFSFLGHLYVVGEVFARAATEKLSTFQLTH